MAVRGADAHRGTVAVGDNHPGQRSGLQQLAVGVDLIGLLRPLQCADGLLDSVLGDCGCNLIDAERITPDSYISIAGWAFQGLRPDDQQKQIPFALPAIDARFRVDDLAGGKLEIQGNSLAITRIEGQDTQRAFASIRWDLVMISVMAGMS